MKDTILKQARKVVYLINQTREEEKIEITDEYVKEKFQETVHKEDLDRFIL